ncbi:MAG: hypothetical protein ACJ746_18230 [Bryobacteraceae bacterium]
MYEGEEYVRYTGVRRDESEARKDAPLESWDEWYDWGGRTDKKQSSFL